LVNEKRKEKRIQEENRVLIELPGAPAATDPSLINALTQDISLGGARIMTSENFAVGSFVKMTLYLSRSKQVIKIQAEVRWSRAVDAGLYEVGVEFRHGIPLGVITLINHLYGKEQRVPTSVHAKQTTAGPG
jgi:c-di-GMP-binding flagellar brake protein YcgR